MSQRLTRKEIKRDELVEALERSAGFVERNARALVIAAIVVVVALLAGFGAWTWLKVEARKGGTALTEALEVYRAPVGEEASTAEPDEPSFPTAEARRERAKELFAAVADHHGMTDAADVAGVYLGQIAMEEGDSDRARELWQGYLDEHPEDLLGREVRLNLLALDRQQGQGEAVASRLEAMLDAGPDERPLPGDLVLWELAKTYEDLGRTQQAQETYRRLGEEYPRSPFGAEARQKAGPAAAPTANLPGLG